LNKYSSGDSIPLNAPFLFLGPILENVTLGFIKVTEHTYEYSMQDFQYRALFIPSMLAVATQAIPIFPIMH
jgi:hypothetical protein